MKTVRFLQTKRRQRAGHEETFLEGEKYRLADDVADHYIRRGAAEVVEETASKKAAPAPSKASTNPPSTESSSDGHPVDDSADLGGDDGRGAGQRPEPAGDPAHAAPVGKAARKGAGNKASKAAAKRAGKASKK